MENQIINQIQKELDRLCLSPIPGEQEGVDAFGVIGHPELVVLADQEVECLNAQAVLDALKAVETPDEDEDDRETYERYGYAIQDLEDFDVETWFEDGGINPDKAYYLAQEEGFHVTRVSDRGVYGHSDTCCDEGGCAAGSELYFAEVDTNEVEAGHVYQIAPDGTVLSEIEV